MRTEPSPTDPTTRTGKVVQWGNSAAVRLAAPMLARAHLSVDDAIEIVARDDEIIIRRQRPKLALADLLEKFDPQRHRHDLAFDAPPTGSETP